MTILTKAFRVALSANETYLTILNLTTKKKKILLEFLEKLPKNIFYL